MTAAHVMAQSAGEGPPPVNNDGSWKRVTTGSTKGKPYFREIGEAKSISTFDVIVDNPNPLKIPNADWEKGRQKLVVPSPPGEPESVTLDKNGVATNALTHDFIGIGQTDLRPPDNSLAVGRDHVVQCVNAEFRISDKLGATLFTTDIGDWLGDPTGFYFDPKVVYDPWRSNWCMLWHLWDDAAQQSQLVMIGSDDSNPIGTWYVHRFDSDFTIGGLRCKPDYFDLGYGDKALVISGNMFRWNGTGFAAGAVAMFDPAQIYANTGAGWFFYYGFTNVDGTASHTIRPARQLWNFGGDWDQIFVNSRHTGGNRITVWKLVDPLNTAGAQAFVKDEILTVSYSLPPNATQQGTGSTLDTIDCRLMPVWASRAASGVTTSSTLWTGLNDASADGLRAEARLLILDPIAGTKHLDTSFTDGTNNYWFPNAVANYEQQCNWVFARSGSATYGEARYVSWDPTNGLGTSQILKVGEGPYTLTRWGDYFGTDVDWGDYNRNGGTTGKQKMWMYAEYAETGNAWGTWVGCVRPIGAVAGAMTLTGASLAEFDIVRGGSTSVPGSYGYTVGNQGEVGYVYRLRGLPTWLQGSPSQAEIGANPDTQAVTVSLDSPAYNLAYGVYNDTFSFENGYSGALINRSARLWVAERLVPTQLTVELGRINAGNIGGLATPNDGNTVQICKFIVPNQQVAPITFRVESNLSGTAAIGEMVFSVRSKMSNSGLFSQTLDMYNWGTASYDPVDVRTDVINTTYATRQLAATGVRDRYLDANRRLRARIRIRQTGPSATVNWCADFDEASWMVVPH